jgi:excisionase family DNA binding protein
MVAIPARLVTLKEAAATLGISQAFLRQLRQSGKVRTISLGRRAVRISADEVKRLADGRAVGEDQLEERRSGSARHR